MCEANHRDVLLSKVDLYFVGFSGWAQTITFKDFIEQGKSYKDQVINLHILRYTIDTSILGRCKPVIKGDIYRCPGAIKCKYFHEEDALHLKHVLN